MSQSISKKLKNILECLNLGESDIDNAYGYKGATEDPRNVVDGEDSRDMGKVEQMTDQEICELFDTNNKYDAERTFSCNG